MNWGFPILHRAFIDGRYLVHAIELTFRIRSAIISQSLGVEVDDMGVHCADRVLW